MIDPGRLSIRRVVPCNGYDTRQTASAPLHLVAGGLCLCFNFEFQTSEDRTSRVCDFHGTVQTSTKRG